MAPTILRNNTFDYLSQGWNFVYILSGVISGYPCANQTIKDHDFTLEWEEKVNYMQAEEKETPFDILATRKQTNDSKWSPPHNFRYDFSYFLFNILRFIEL